MKKSTVWTEEVTFVECPECGEPHALGTDVSVNKGGTTIECEECGARFLAVDPG
jgi:transcription elongation factor Elf1